MAEKKSYAGKFSNDQAYVLARKVPLNRLAEIKKSLAGEIPKKRKKKKTKITRIKR